MRQSLSPSLPSSELAAVCGQLWATTRAELVMQWRRLGFWFAFCVISIIGIAATLYIVRLYTTSPEYIHGSALLLTNGFVSRTIRGANTLFGIIVGLLVSDRIPRDRTLRMVELQQTTSQRYPVYMLGKFLGNMIATLVPSCLVVLLCGTMSLLYGGTFSWLLSLGIAFLLVFIPVFAIVVAFTLLASAVFPQRLIQVVLPFIWVYITSASGGEQKIATLIFSVTGQVVLDHFFYEPGTRPAYTLQDVVLNIALLLISTAVFLLLAIFCLSKRSEHNILV
jgi:MFS family permease